MHKPGKTREWKIGERVILAMSAFITWNGLLGRFYQNPIGSYCEEWSWTAYSLHLENKK